MLMCTTKARQRDTNYCWPDIVITRNGEVRAVIEIEQTGISSPNKLSGKVLSTLLSNHLYSDEIGTEPAPCITGSVTFVQIVNTAQCPAASQKLLQYANLEASIRSILPLRCVHRYFLVPVSAGVAPPYDMAKYHSVFDAIEEALL